MLIINNIRKYCTAICSWQVPVLLCILWAVLLPCSVNAQSAKIKSLTQELVSAKDFVDSSKLYYRIAYWYEIDGDIPSSLKSNRAGLQISLKNNDSTRQAAAYYFIGNCYANQDLTDSAVYYCKKTISLYDKLGKKTIYYTYALNLIAGDQLKKGNNTEALKYAQLALNVSEEINDTVCMSNANTMFSAIYQSLGDMDKCIHYSEKALELNRKSGTVYNLSLVVNNLGTLYMMNNEPAKALPLLHESLDLALNTFKSAKDKGKAYMTLGVCHDKLGQYDSALHYLQMADPILVEYNEPELLQELYRAYASVYQSLTQYDTALIYINKSIAITEKYNITIGHYTSLLRKADILAMMGNYADAYVVYREYHDLNKASAGKEVQKKIAELQEKYESGKKDQEIAQQLQLNKLLRNESLLKDEKLKNELLVKAALESQNLLAQEQIVQDSVLKTVLARENELKKKQLVQAEVLNTTLEEENILREADLKNQRAINVLLTGGIAIVLLLGSLIFLQYRRQRAANKTISEQSNKLTLLMKELHHRVKNNLQIISSLLSLQSFRIKDEAASNAVREGQQRIEAMSLIHQRLYTRDNITEINIREFISDLVDSLQSAYGFGKDDIAVTMNIDDELMNVDQAIPLSLIVNELVTNAFKYAYQDNDKPELKIKLNKDKDGLHLVVSDNGKGVNMEEWKDKEGSFGKELIQTFVKQLNGYLSIVVDKGTQFKLSFPNTA